MTPVVLTALLSAMGDATPSVVKPSRSRIRRRQFKTLNKVTCDNVQMRAVKMGVKKIKLIPRQMVDTTALGYQLRCRVRV
jgi:hypothetical protein